MKNKLLMHTLFFFILSMSVLAQKGPKQELENKVATDKFYNKLCYIDAIKTYENLYNKGIKNQDMLQKLANSYYFNGDLIKAEKYYGELFALKQYEDSEYYYRYAQSLKAVKNYAKADEILAKFYEMSKTDLRAKLSDSQKNYLDLIKKNSQRYTLQDAGINTKFSDYGSAYFKDKVVFASARETDGMTTKTTGWTGEAYTNLFVAKMDSKGELSKVDKLSSSINSKYHESTPVFTKDGKTVYFTRNNYLKAKGKDKEGTTLLKLYRATLVKDEWTNITELPFNSDQYSVAHPTLSADEKTLFFASNMPGTIGESDIFKTAINGNGFGPIINLGPDINTEGRETFPFITPENELFFASDGHPGLGGLDVFASKPEKDGSYKFIVNVGEPINSPTDDFGYIINNATRQGYVTSNREGGHGNDDIYRFNEVVKLDYTCKQILTGIITDKDTGKILPNTKVTLSDINFNVIDERTSDKDGRYDFGEVACSSKYNIKYEKETYNTIEKPTVTTTETGSEPITDAPKKGKIKEKASPKVKEKKEKIPVEVAIEKTKKPVEVGDDVAKAIDIKMIYFDLDKSDIRDDAEIELEKILDVLLQNPKMHLDIRSHTDCRNTEAYNMALSNRRAKSTIKWLTDNGISKKRLTGRGYGESELVNDCGCEPTNESSCTDEQHQENRRSEFIITKL